MIFLILLLCLGLGISPSFKEISNKITILDDTGVKAAKVVDDELVSSNLVKDIDTFYSVPQSEVINYSDMDFNTLYSNYSYGATSITGGAISSYRTDEVLDYENGTLSYSFTYAIPPQPEQLAFGYLLEIDENVPLIFGIRSNKTSNTFNVNYRIFDSEFATLSNGQISTWSSINANYSYKTNTNLILTPANSRYLFVSYYFIVYPSSSYAGDIVIDEFFVSSDGNKGYEPYYSPIPLDLKNEYDSLKAAYDLLIEDYDTLRNQYNSLFNSFSFVDNLSFTIGGLYDNNGSLGSFTYEVPSSVYSAYISSNYIDLNSILVDGLKSYFNVSSLDSITGGLFSINVDFPELTYLYNAFPFSLSSSYLNNLLTIVVDYDSDEDSYYSFDWRFANETIVSNVNTPFSLNNTILSFFDTLTIGAYKLGSFADVSLYDNYSLLSASSNLSLSFNLFYSNGYNQGYQDGYNNIYEYRDTINSLNNDISQLQIDIENLRKSYQYLTYQEIYNKGYSDGLSTAESFNETGGIMSFFGVIANIPFVILNGLSPALVFNMPLVYALTGLLFVALIVWIIKKFI